MSDDELVEIIRDALPFVETYEEGDMLFKGMSRATYDDLVLRMRMAVQDAPNEDLFQAPEEFAGKAIVKLWNAVRQS